MSKSPPSAVTSTLRSRPVVISVLALATIAAVVAAVLAVGSDSGASATTLARNVTVKRGVIQSTVSGSGTLSAQRDRELAFATAGTIKKVFVESGDHVSKHEVLARLRTTDGGTRRLRAPFAGTVASVQVGEGDTVGGASSSSSSASTSPLTAAAGGSAGSSSSDTTTAFELVSLKGYDMTVSLAESDIGKVKKGQTATVTVEATGDELAARVRHVSLLPTSSSTSSSATIPSASSSSAVSYSVTLRLTQSASDLKPGMSASANIVTAETTGVTVPTSALRGNTVTVSNNGKKTTARVQTGTAGDDATQILSGLNAGDTVVITSRSAAAGTSATGAGAGAGQQSGGLGGGGFPGGGGGFPGGGIPGGGGLPAGGPPGGGFGG